MKLTAFTNQRFEGGLDLTALDAEYGLAANALRFVSQIRRTEASLIPLYAWDSLSPPAAFPAGRLVYQPSTKRLEWYAPSTDMLRIFHPDGGAFVWDFGFYLAAAPADFIRADGGPAEFVPGVTR